MVSCQAHHVASSKHPSAESTGINSSGNICSSPGMAHHLSTDTFRVGQRRTEMGQGQNNQNQQNERNQDQNRQQNEQQNREQQDRNQQNRNQQDREEEERQEQQRR